MLKPSNSTAVYLAGIHTINVDLNHPDRKIVVQFAGPGLAWNPSLGDAWRLGENGQTDHHQHQLATNILDLLHRRTDWTLRPLKRVGLASMFHWQDTTSSVGSCYTMKDADPKTIFNFEIYQGCLNPLFYDY